MKLFNLGDYTFSVQKNDGFGDYALFLYLLVKNCGLERVLEIGVDQGFSTKLLLKAIRETNGWLYSIDIEDKKDLFPSPEYWTFIKADSSTFQWSDEFPIDLLFLDGDHSYKGALGDLNNFYKHVRKGGFVVIHDSNMPTVKKAINHFFKNKSVERMEFPFKTDSFVVIKKA